MKKRLLSLLLALAMCLSLAPAALAEGTVYRINETTIHDIPITYLEIFGTTDGTDLPTEGFDEIIIEETGVVTGGTYTADVMNYGTITGGHFTRAAAALDNSGLITGGTFDVVLNRGTAGEGGRIEGGYFGEVHNGGTIVGGTIENLDNGYQAIVTGATVTVSAINSLGILIDLVLPNGPGIVDNRGGTFQATMSINGKDQLCPVGFEVQSWLASNVQNSTWYKVENGERIPLAATDVFPHTKAAYSCLSLGMMGIMTDVLTGGYIARVGDTVTVFNSSARWYVDDVQVSGRLSGPGYAYTIQSADVGKIAMAKLITVDETVCGTPIRVVDSLSVVLPANASIGEPIVPEFNWKLNPANMSYQWQRNGVNIDGATADTYTPTAQDDGANLTMVVSYKGTTYTTNAAAVGAAVLDYTCQLAALEVSCDAEVLLRMKMIIGEEIINDDNACVVMTKNGVDTIFTAADLRAMGTDTKGRYVLEQGIASGEMTYPVTVKIYNGNGQLENIYDYVTGKVATSSTRSVLDYAERIFNLGTQEQKDLIAALVTYGGYSQMFFGTDAGNPAYNVLTKCGMEIPAIEAITVDAFTQEISRTGDAIGITQTNNRVFLDSAIYLRSYFVLDEGKSIEDYTFTLTYSVNNNERTKELKPQYDAANNRYYVNIEDIAAAYLDYMYTITVTNGSGTYVVKTSALAWAKLAMQATDDISQINMIKAMYFYNQAANTYFGK